MLVPSLRQKSPSATSDMMFSTRVYKAHIQLSTWITTSVKPINVNYGTLWNHIDLIRTT